MVTLITYMLVIRHITNRYIKNIFEKHQSRVEAYRYNFYCSKMISFFFFFTAKKLPKNEQSGSASTSGQGRRLVESDGQKVATGNCCK